MAWVATAIVGSAVVGGIATTQAGRAQSRAAQNAANAQLGAAQTAADAQLQATRESNDLARQMFELQRSDAAPWRQAGTVALGDLLTGLGLQVNLPQRIDGLPQPQDAPGSGLIGPGGAVDSVRGSAPTQTMLPAQTLGDRNAAGFGEFQRNLTMDPSIAGLTQQLGDLASDRFDMSDFQQDPGYAFRLREGEEAINRAAASAGRFDSGRALKDLTRFGQEFASNEFGNAFNRFQTERGNRFNLLSNERTGRFNMAASDRDSRFNRLSSLAGLGSAVNSQIGAAGQAMAGQVGSNTMQGTALANQALIGGANNAAQLQTQAANARASGYVGAANALTGGVGQMMNWQQSNRLMDLLQQPRGWVSQG